MYSIFDYILSIHYLPASLSVFLSCLAAAWGVGWKICLLMACMGLLVTCAAFYFQPLQCFFPLGGHFNVGTREVCGERGSMKPPVTIVYPTASGTPHGGIQYIPFGERGYLVGMARYSKLPYVLVKDLLLMRKKMRADAEPAPLFRHDGTPRPMIVFSHGLGGFPHLYSTLLMDLAVRGAVVFAISHMDGSAAYCRDAGREIRIPLNTQVGWTTEDRVPQIEVRIRETLNTIKRIRNGELLLVLGYDKETVDRYIKMEPRVHLVGHSFGGATCLAAALQDEDEVSEKGGVSSIASTVVYDPWMIPLKTIMFYEKLTDSKQPVHFITPTLQIFSEEWVRNEEQLSFFEEVKTIVDEQPRTTEENALVAAVDAKLRVLKASWYTMKKYHGTGHLTCTDVSLFSPVLYRAQYMKASPRGSIVALAVDTMVFIEKVSGPLPLDTTLLDDSVFAAALKA
ncbi:phospholipase A2-like protein, putative [Leishmania tarentolae]|uniref:1-alkyl-2-acetylglycerophosphocholine esterase n=1 Tax=Leishmania tarentolae TaxID=5689 RepID=A0A640KSU7_LEITA|nr:phospholipase A2-like protein, putative [Leishmania tarentolae]